jgi:hypothetical protein
MRSHDIVDAWNMNVLAAAGVKLFITHPKPRIKHIEAKKHNLEGACFSLVVRATQHTALGLYRYYTKEPTQTKFSNRFGVCCL